MVMENGSNHYEPRRTGSFGRTSSASSSLRRRSFSISSVVPSQVEDEIESETVSEAGDIGDRALHSNRFSASGSLRLDNNDSALENGLAFSVPENNLLQSYGYWSRDATTLNTVSAVSPLPEEIKSPLATKPLVCSEDKNQGKVIPKPLEYISCLIHLAFFGILGVLTRYLLQKLFGPKVAGVTSNLSILYLDLPSNMVGSFLMGWFGVVFKADISRVSDYLAIGLSTGYLGSLTTFSGWNQKMLDLTIGGNWVFAFLGFVIGLFLAAYSIIFGVETAKGFRWLLNRWHKSSTKGTPPDSGSNFKVDTFMRHLSVMLVLVLMLGGLLSLSGVLLRKEFNSGSDEAQLWLGCIVAPLGVWMRWFLARLNGRGLGRAGTLKWVPFGTLIANIAAAGVMTALATVKKRVNTQTCNTVASGLQFGLMGCLSTVSTFMAEFNAMRESKYPWRAYAYALTTILVSFGMGILIYSVPVWTMKLEEHV